MLSSKNFFKKGKITHFEVSSYLKKHTKKKTNRKLRKLGFHLCKDCNGVGFTTKRQIKPISRSFKNCENLFHLCIKCNGRGFVDWVEEILK